MSRLSKEFRIDAKRATEGVEFIYTSRSGEVLFRCRLARLGSANKRYVTIHEEVMAPYRKLKPTPEHLEELNRQVFCRSVIVPGTWETMTPEGYVPGIEMEDGIHPATWENIATVLKTEEDLYLLLLQESFDREHFRATELEADSKNS